MCVTATGGAWIGTPGLGEQEAVAAGAALQRHPQGSRRARPSSQGLAEEGRGASRALTPRSPILLLLLFSTNGGSR